MFKNKLDLTQSDKNCNNEMLILPKTTIKALLLVIFGSLIVSFAIFFMVLENNEITVVPNLYSLTIEDAVVELQRKELIPYIEFKFSSSALDKGKVIDQGPKPGTVLRHGNKVIIFISKGAIINRVDNFIGKNIDDVIINLNANSFDNSKLLYHIGNPLEVESELPKGIIISQNPSPGSQISSLTDLQFLISKGKDRLEKHVKNYIGIYYKDAIASLLNDSISFDIDLANTSDFGNIIFQSIPPGTKINEPDKILITIAKPKVDNKIVFGILTYKLRQHLSYVDISVRLKGLDGKNSLMYSFKSKGGLIKLPYEAQKGSTIELYIYDKLINQTVIN
ncbi:PASTA domain-containing protein [Borreliella carolinensis]|uniref:PASTA domain-containing protein n=1 Tax=Borreliella carolinensis TaxID=478174 RepID=A0ABY9E4B5_9SPIR|nr:PASTA domain-containing protein [Borreliella carolinensis]WKC90475.1 PASTA domain-containing protein [Borreliella carolinensis]WNY67407.1 PASTA domain-containing protein [Borreliella carolinensis]